MENMSRPQVTYTRIPRDKLKQEFHKQHSTTGGIQGTIYSLVTSRPAVTLAVAIATGVVLGWLIKRR